MRIARFSGAALLGCASALHFAWGQGSSWPARDRKSLTDAVAGTSQLPTPAACRTVGAALAVSAALAGGFGADRSAARLARAGVAGVLILRGLTGVAGRTAMIAAWTPSERFTELDRRCYGPLCLVMGALVATGSIGGREMMTAESIADLDGSLWIDVPAMRRTVTSIAWSRSSP